MRNLFLIKININRVGIFPLWGCWSKFLKNDVFMSLKNVFILANSADPDKMPHDVAFHLGLHCLTKYLFTGVLYL